MLPLTPSQTVGPFLHLALPWPEGPLVVPPGHPHAIELSGRVLDGAGEPVPDGLVEVWQVDPDGRTVEDTADPAFRGFGRCDTDGEGRYRFTTVRPGPVRTVDGVAQVPHVDLLVFARGLLRHLAARAYFLDGPASASDDPVLAGLTPADRDRLTARPVQGGYTFDIHLQGPDETPFFAF